MKQLSQGDSNSSSFLIQGFRLYCDASCNFGGCIFSNSTHYHCNACGFAVAQVDECQNHRATCSGPNYNTLGRSYDPMYPTPPQGQQGGDCTSTFYPIYGIAQTTVPPTISPGTGAASYYRTQPPVFSPFYTTGPFDGFAGQSHDSWQRPMDARATPKDGRPASVKSNAPSSCLFAQSLDSYVDAVDFMPRGNQQPQTRAAQKQLPSLEPSLGLIMVPEDGMYSPASFTFHSIAGDAFTDNKTSPFPVVDDLSSESCIPFPPVPSHQPPSCILEPSVEDQDSEIGSEENEIIVEETGEDLMPNLPKQHCAVCNELCGWSAVVLREDHPVTLSSRTAVWTKLLQTMGAKILGQLREGSVLCCSCMHLLNTVDQLQTQLCETSNRLVERLKSPEEELPDHVHRDVAMLEAPERDHPDAGAMVPEPVAVEGEEAPALEPAAPTFLDRPTFKCDVCDKEFATRKAISSHVRKHVGRPKVHFKLMCELCGRQFNHRNNLAAHKPVCSGKFPLHCKICEKGFVIRSALKIHEATHNGKYPLRCEICQKGFLKMSDLTVHKRTHSGEKPYICETCGKGFASVGNYNHHAKVHQKERPYVCQVCNKGFLRRGYLLVHLNRHDGHKPFQCDKCGKSFPDGSNLYHHKRLHEGYKPYTCPICNKALSSGLQAHIRTHTGVRPFACPKCSSTFTASNALKKHLKRHKD